MARKALIYSSEIVYHVTARTNNKEWYPVPLKDCWYIYGHYLSQLNETYNVQIHAFVLMSNHFHLLLSTPEKNIHKAMNYFMTQTSKGIGKVSDKINHLYGGRYSWNYAEDSFGYNTLIKYVYRNPLRANICSQVQDYPWSTLQAARVKFKLVGHKLDVEVPGNQFIPWLNQPLESEEKIIKNLFKKSKIEQPTKRSNRKKDSFVENYALLLPKGDEHL